MKKFICIALTGIMFMISSPAFAEESTKEGQNSSYSETEQNCKDGVCQWRK